MTVIFSSSVMLKSEYFTLQKQLFGIDTDTLKQSYGLCLEEDSSKTLQVETYVWFNKRDPNLHGEWDFEPLFPGENTVDQLVEITKVLGTPTREEIRCMNPNYTDFRFPQIKAHPWHKVCFHLTLVVPRGTTICCLAACCVYHSS
nr:uncharacterized protein LOC112941301 [Solanum lycopersicum]